MLSKMLKAVLPNKNVFNEKFPVAKHNGEMR